ncbi:acyltransferase family protein [Aridibaculum aurantiacum]|uniref:acyltransferase family protein n=1 Tax=Aridibaculum aurantiacum TaxID=2810307 RepID=UPI001A97733E
MHGYNLNETYLTPYSLVKERLTFTTFIEYFLANGALRFRIPLLFIISGYIYALQDNKPYAQRIAKRFNTLIIPFFIWSAVGMLITYLWQQHPVTAQAVYDAQLDQLGDNRPYSEMTWEQLFIRFIYRPPSFQLWFIRSLFFYNLLYPFFRWAVTKYPVIWFSIAFIGWYSMTTFLFLEAQGIFFFTLGIWICKTEFPIEKKPEWFSHFLGWLFFIGISIIKTFMAFELEPDHIETRYILTTLHLVSVVSGIIVIWFGGDALVKFFMHKRWFLWSVSFAFIIYALHVPLTHYLTRLAFLYVKGFAYYRLLTYLVVPVLVLFICMGVGALLRAAFPRFYRIATGGRGF